MLRGTILMARHVVSMGGGGFSDVGEVTALERYVLDLTGKESPRVCFIATASGDAEGYIWKFCDAFQRAGVGTAHLPLFNRSEDAEIEETLLSSDVVLVGGGNTANLLAIWNLHGITPLLKQAYERGIVMAGVSAGGLCWFQCGLTDSFGPSLRFLSNGLGLLPGAFCPHLDSEEFRRRRYLEELLQNHVDGYGADDNAALHFADESLHKAVAFPGQNAYRFRIYGDMVHEEVLTPQVV